MLTKTIHVQHQHHSYPIYIGNDLFNHPDYLLPHLSGNKVMIVTNDTIAALYLNAIRNLLKGIHVEVCILPDGEAYKDEASWRRILDSLVACECHRDATLIALGGGVVGDITGFAAACYYRGIAFIQIPTTLLAQVDSSIGGKTAINHPAGKNLIGAFHQPNAVIINTDTLATLPSREFKAGLSEIIKAALIQDETFFDFIEKNLDAILHLETKALDHCIARACEIKSNIVQQDEKEQGIRALLNFGHTFGHVFEQQFGYGTWLHGEAVAQGMLMASDLSCELGLLDQTSVQRIKNLFTKLQMIPPKPKSISVTDFIHTLRKDKKVKEDTLRFILLTKIGGGMIRDDIPKAALEKLLTDHLSA